MTGWRKLLGGRPMGGRELESAPDGVQCFFGRTYLELFTRHDGNLLICACRKESLNRSSMRGHVGKQVTSIIIVWEHA